MKACIVVLFFVVFFLFPALANAEVFLVDSNFDLLGRGSLDADAIYSGKKSLFFVERNYFNALPAQDVQAFRASVEYLMAEFDQNIYPGLREAFGEERTPGPDGDDKIYIVLHQMKDGVGGYVRKEDIGVGEIVYLNINEIDDPLVAPAYLAHEFQHLITFNQKNTLRGIEEEKWLNEARSEYAPTLLGYNDIYKGSYLEKRVNEFLTHPSGGLLDWQDRSIDHASASIFMHYLVGRFGQEILSLMTSSGEVGAQSIDQAIASAGYSERFVDVFVDFELAVYVNSAIGEENAENFKFQNKNLSVANLRVLPVTTFRVYDNNSTGASFAIDNWSGQWHRFVPGAIGEDTTLHVRVDFPNKDGFSMRYIVNDFFGSAVVKSFDISSTNILSIENFGREVSSVVVVPIFAKEGKENESLTGGYALEGFVSNSLTTRFAEGALVRAREDDKVYIVKNSNKIGEVFMRWVQTPEVFGFYRHFTWNDIIEVKPQLLESFRESFLIRKAGDYRIYEVDSSGNKKWLDITAGEFEEAGYSWRAVYEVNEAEFEWFS